MTKTARNASTRKTTSAPDSMLSLLLGLQPEREAVDARHLAALAAAERALVTVARVPRRPAQLRLAELARREVVSTRASCPTSESTPTAASGPEARRRR